MPSILENLTGLFRRRSQIPPSEMIQESNTVSERQVPNQIIREVVSDNRPDNAGPLADRRIVSITESTVGYSPNTLSQMITDDGINAGQLLTGLRSNFSLRETFIENEEMARDSVIGSVMEIIADDVCQVDERRGAIVTVESEDEELQRFLQDFLTNNINIEDRIWTWVYEIVKHGDFKLRRREYYAGSNNSGVKSVFYEDVINPYLVSRIEYMGNVLGYEDEDYDDPLTASNAMTGDYQFSDGLGTAKFERAEEFVHFMSSKLSKREKVRLSVRDENGKIDVVTCYRVCGTSILDNARYVFRIVNMLDNMIVLSRIARSTQYNLIKVEVGQASASKTQEILMDVRRRIEGSTRIKKNVGMKSDPSPIPINSNVYVPVREGKGDVSVESIGESLDVKSIADIEYFKNKEFAALKVPQQYVGFEECFHPDTLVRIGADKSCYRDYTIKYLAEHPEIWEGEVIQTCAADGRVSLSKILRVRKTRLNANFVSVLLSTGRAVCVTPDHKIMLADGTFKEAQDLEFHDRLMHQADDEKLSRGVYVLAVHRYQDDNGNDVILDAYDLDVENENHTFLLAAGIYVHNSLGSLGNNSLAKMDLRYARSAQRVMDIAKNGIRNLCNNYLLYRGRPKDVNRFRIWMRPLVTQDTAGRVEEFMSNAQAIDSFASTLDSYKEYLDKAKVLKMLLNLVGISPVEVASEEYMKILKEISEGTYKEENHKPAEGEGDEDDMDF